MNHDFDRVKTKEGSRKENEFDISIGIGIGIALVVALSLALALALPALRFLTSPRKPTYAESENTQQTQKTSGANGR